MNSAEELGLCIVDPFKFLRELNLCFEDGKFIYKEARKTEIDKHGNVSGAFDLSFLRYTLLDDIPFAIDAPQNVGRVNFDVKNLISNDGVCDGICEYLSLLLNSCLKMPDGRVVPPGIIDFFGHYNGGYRGEVKRNDYVYCPGWLPIFRRSDKKGILGKSFPDEWFTVSGIEVKDSSK